MWWTIILTLIFCVNINSSKDEQVNVFGKKLEQCSVAPMTGFYRSGSCEWDGPSDSGVHSVCAQMTNQFLEYTRSRGNDLSTPNAWSGFPGLREGDRWCLCAGRWKQAFDANAAPPVILRSTHRISLQHVGLDDLRKHALGNANRRRAQNKS